MRYYDQAGLLSPTRNASGYRCYTEQDLPVLQQILALKFLGFSLEEIRTVQRRKTASLAVMLARQRLMMQEKRQQIDVILRALASAEEMVQAGKADSDAIVEVIQAIQMEQTQEWAKKYFSEEQRAKLETLSQESYSESAREKLAAREWTEADQTKISAQWAYVAQESERLASIGADPAGEEGQALARLKHELLFAFTQGAPEIEEGLQKFWDSHNALLSEEQPLTDVMPETVNPGSDSPGARFLDQAMEHLRR